MRYVKAILISYFRFSIFAQPVDKEDAPDYYEVIENPMDLETMMSKVDLHKYESAADFKSDIEVIMNNAHEYNPDKDQYCKSTHQHRCGIF